MKLTNEEREVLKLAMNLLGQYYDKKINTCKKFKWICHKYLPQSGDDYTANINVFNIEDKTVEDIKTAKEAAHSTIMKLLNNY